MAGRKILVRLALVSVIVSIQPATAQTTIEVSPPVTIEINPGPGVVFAPMPYGLRQSNMYQDDIAARTANDIACIQAMGDAAVCDIQAPESLRIGSPQYQAFVKQCKVEAMAGKC